MGVKEARGWAIHGSSNMAATATAMVTFRAPEAWTVRVTVAAQLRGMSRSAYIRGAALEAADRDLRCSAKQRKTGGVTMTNDMRTQRAAQAAEEVRRIIFEWVPSDDVFERGEAFAAVLEEFRPDGAILDASGWDEDTGLL
ncbi:MAG: hypothetical protein ACYTDU_18520, partial [Planctomycetota bacterium]